MQLSDELLLQRIREGDATSWEELVARYQGRLVAAARRRLRDQSLAHDVVQETFLALHKAASHLPATWDLQTFLFSVLRNKIVDVLRKQGRHPVHHWPEDPHFSAVAYAGAGPSTCCRRQERQELEAQTLAEVLRELVTEWKQRGDYERLQVIELLFVKGWPNRQVAAFLGLAPQRVANLRFAVVERLRQLLQKRALNPDVFPELQTPHGGETP
ncbi:ECF RNA polymerase sigma-E factor [bacterium HR36]|nr:ECF RNA polymerase sigma-E factor [bacterium HR36]